MRKIDVDKAEIRQGPRDPAPKPVLSRLFWAALGLALACVVAGGVVGFYGSTLFPADRPHAQTLGKPPPRR